MPSTTVNTAVLPSIAISSCTLTNTVKDLIIRAQVRDTGLLDDPFDKKAKEKVPVEYDYKSLPWGEDTQRLNALLSKYKSSNRLPYDQFKIIDLTGKKLSAIGPDLRSFNRLVDLNLTGNRMGNSGLVTKYLPVTLEKLTLNNTKLSEFPDLRHLNRLRHIGLSFNQISEIPQPITQCLPENIISIDLSWNWLSSLRFLVRALLPYENRLKILCLMGNPLTLMGIRYKPRILNAFPKLSVLDDVALGEHRDRLAGLKYNGDLSSALDEDTVSFSFNLQLTEASPNSELGGVQSAVPAAPVKKSKDAPVEPVVTKSWAIELESNDWKQYGFDEEWSGGKMVFEPGKDKRQTISILRQFTLQPDDCLRDCIKNAGFKLSFHYQTFETVDVPTNGGRTATPPKGSKKPAEAAMQKVKRLISSKTMWSTRIDSRQFLEGVIEFELNLKDKLTAVELSPPYLTIKCRLGMQSSDNARGGRPVNEAEVSSRINININANSLSGVPGTVSATLGASLLSTNISDNGPKISVSP